MQKNSARRKMKNLAIGAFSVLAFAGCEVQDGKYAELAQCLTEKGVKMYGAYWCPHCQTQKKAFGPDIRYVDYVECDPKGKDARPDECREAGVGRYPTWSFPGQENITGEQSPEDLAKKVNCPVPGTTSEEGSSSGTQTTATATSTK